MFWLALAALGLARVSIVSCTSLLEDEFQLTPAQQRVLELAQRNAVSASKVAENQLLEAFSSKLFRWRLASEEPETKKVLSQLSDQELLNRVKAALQAVEWTNNFELDAASLKAHGGNAGFDIDTVEEFNGTFPTMWHLKAVGHKIVQNVSARQWGVMNAAETGLYQLPNFQRVDPTIEESDERPKYLAVNLRQLDAGVQRYGVIAAVVRGDVLRERAVLVGSDTGGWESGCNKSVIPVQPANWMAKLIATAFIDCDAVKNTPLGVYDHQLHTLLANSQTFERVGGDLARVVFQLLGREASVRPLEGNMYAEGALLGPMRTVDLKVLVASFPGVFGTKEGEKLRSFCLKHNIPLAWAFSSGRSWPDEEAQHLNWAPFEPFEFWPTPQQRLLDPIAGWTATNVSVTNQSIALWADVWANVSSARSVPNPTGGFLSKDFFQSRWAELKSNDISIAMLRGGDCTSVDLCFGTVPSASGYDCVCRKLPAKQKRQVPAVETIEPFLLAV